MCGCECLMCAKSIHALLLSWRDRYLKKLKDQSQKQKVWQKNCIYETYKNTVMPHGRHIYAKSSDMEKAIMFPYPQSDHSLSHWKRVLRCCDNYPCINLTDQEKDNQYSDTTHSIRFHIYIIIARCTDNGIITPKDKKISHKCKQESSTEKSTKIYTRKEIVMMETTISDFHTSFYIPDIQRLDFQLPHMHIIGTNNCAELQLTSFKRSKLFQGVLCRCDYDERVVAIFSHKIRS